MQVRTKIILMVVVGLLTWGLEQYFFLGSGPTMTAEMAVQQLKTGTSPETLRLVDSSKNYLALTTVALFGFLLFASNIWHWLGTLTGEDKCYKWENSR